MSRNIAAIAYVCVFLSGSVHSEINYTLIKYVIEAIERMLSYYEGNFEHMNLDGIYGLRILEGELSYLLLPSVNRQPDGGLSSGRQAAPLVKRLWAAHARCVAAARRALPHLWRADQRYYTMLAPLIEAALPVVGKKYYRLNETLQGPEVLTVSMSEEESDACMAELLGPPRCHVSDSCMLLMSRRGGAEFHLTHQLLHSTLAEQLGCLPTLDAWFSRRHNATTVTSLRQEMCAACLREMREKVGLLRGRIPPVYQDLFLEQEYVCPSLGYLEFLHADWLTQILAWQRPSGCYGRMPRDPGTGRHVSNGQYDYQEEDEASLAAVVQQGNTSVSRGGAAQSEGWRSRRLMREKQLADNCLSHKTAVAAGALSQYLYALLHPGPKEYAAHVSLQGRNALLDPRHLQDSNEEAGADAREDVDVDTLNNLDWRQHQGKDGDENNAKEITNEEKYEVEGTIDVVNKGKVDQEIYYHYMEEMNERGGGTNAIKSLDGVLFHIVPHATKSHSRHKDPGRRRSVDSIVRYNGPTDVAIEDYLARLNQNINVGKSPALADKQITISIIYIYVVILTVMIGALYFLYRVVVKRKLVTNGPFMIWMKLSGPSKTENHSRTHIT